MTKLKELVIENDSGLDALLAIDESFNKIKHLEMIKILKCPIEPEIIKSFGVDPAQNCLFQNSSM